MEFDFQTLSGKDRYKLLVATVVPRPIAWVVTQSASGVVNAAPYSFFNAIAGSPPLLAISIDGRDGERKDTAVNIRHSGQFVVNLVNDAMSHDMVVTAIDFDPTVSETTEAKLATTPSIKIAPPRITASPVAFECEIFQTVELPGNRDLVLGHVVMMHVVDEAVMDAARCYIDTPKLDLVGRMHSGGWYSRTRDQFEIPRIDVADWKTSAG
ncbi:flavin reductase family protein [Acidisphaera sp. L21]|jgi:flavin reductase (DIM6/NTAB) family NADH-FMN oxidoreductase RutF|uniref:flavin reductase family protein n=1 Tax=Acidisphaera sp. L21 TaxID=1641851 RepID=UPI00131E1966|nr:flavin reductase family protein [Acidisphaera sp. L21]